MIAYDDLLIAIREAPSHNYTLSVCSLEFIAKITNTQHSLRRAKKYKVNVKLACQDSINSLRIHHHRKKLIVAPVFTINEVIEWHDRRNAVPNFIPFYQHKYDKSLPTKPYTTWIFILRYLALICGFSEIELSKFKSDVFRIECPLRNRGSQSLDRTLAQLDRTIRDMEQCIGTKRKRYQLKQWKQVRRMYTTLAQSDINDPCSICYNEMEATSVTVCNHVYCTKCLKQWIDDESRIPSCPMCRTDLMGPDAYLHGGDPICVEHGKGLCSVANAVHEHFMYMTKSMELLYIRDK